MYAGPHVTARVFSVGMWVRCDSTAAAATYFQISDTATTNNYYSLRQSTTWGIVARGGGTENSATGGTVTAGKWAYVVARFISATNDRLSVLQYDGTITSLQRTTSRTATGIDLLAVGNLVTTTNSEPWAGSIAEFWITDSDIQPDGAALNNDTLRQLAYKGPFSIPDVAKRVVDYVSFKSGMPRSNLGVASAASVGNIDERYCPKVSSTFGNWQNNGTLSSIVSDHPPLSSEYVTPSAYVSMTLT